MLWARWPGPSSKSPPHTHSRPVSPSPQLTIARSDNNEWGLFELQYGMQLVNRTNGDFTRRYKRSMFDYVDSFQRYVESGRKVVVKAENEKNGKRELQAL